MPNTTANQSAYVNVKDASKRYDVSVPTIWRWVQEGKFPSPVKLASRTTRWRMSDLEAWEQQCSVAA